MSELQKSTVQEPKSVDKHDQKEESKGSSQVLLSPERPRLSGDDDDITPHYVRGYN